MGYSPQFEDCSVPGPTLTAAEMELTCEAYPIGSSVPLNNPDNKYLTIPLATQNPPWDRFVNRNPNFDWLSFFTYTTQYTRGDTDSPITNVADT